jgi:glycosyltransferase involved in cell wall biosynthesis
MRLTVAVPTPLLALAPVGGHGKVWHRVLAELRRSVRIVPLRPGRRRVSNALVRRPQVVLASGHEALPDARAPLVVEVHEAGWITPELRSTIDPTFLAHIAQHTEQAVHAAADVITLSASARSDLISAYGLEPERVHAVYPGVDAVFAGRPDGGRALVASARGGRDLPYVLYASTLHPRKNLPLLRQAMAMLALEGLPHALVIAGGTAPDRADSAALERAATAELEGAPDRIVRFTAPTDTELAALMAGADAFCLPSLYEGFGLTALEAMACGAPVVVSNRGALPEVVGDAGLVVDPAPRPLTDALRTVLRDRSLAERLGRAGVERASAFTWERTAQGWLSVLLEAARAPYTRAG